MWLKGNKQNASLLFQGLVTLSGHVRVLLQHLHLTMQLYLA